MAGYILIGSVILQAISGVEGVLDITCYINHPRININRDDDLFIGGYKSGDDTGATVTFGRETNTGTGSGLPSGSSERNHLGRRALLRDMPQSGGVERIGAFYCQAQKGDVTERTPAIIMASNSVITPQRISQTVNVGDDVTLSVITGIGNTRWRLNGSEIGEWNDLKSVQRSNVEVSHGGIYECIQAGKRTEGRQAIFLLVIRACISGKWGLPACTNDCPVCFNGGICDERSGVCVCAPGFSGNNCEIVHGSNRWGQDGTLKCSGNNLHSTKCRGILFCLPHPYGCSCAAGFYGIDCEQDCQQGTYGANCESVCHCAEGVSCLPDTGECHDGRCNSDWFGVNCQFQCHCAEGVACLLDTGCSDGQCHKDWYGFQCQKRCPAFQTTTGLRADKLPSLMTISVQWEQGPCSTVMLSYHVSNKLQHCPDTLEYSPSLTSNQYKINSWSFYSTYIINVEITRNGDAESSSVSVSTDANVPQIAPACTADPTSDSLTFSWDAIPCESQGGPGLRYAYNLSKNNGIILTDTTYNTTASFSGLDPCTMYTFEVRAVNDIGDGESSVKTVTTSTVEPGPVNNFTISQTYSPNQLSLSWLESTANMCAVEGYIIRYNQINQDQCNEVIGETTMMKTGELIAVLDGLNPYSTYNVSIVANNLVGEGMQRSMFYTTNTSEPTLAPSNVSEVDVGPNHLSLQWLAPPCGLRHGELSYSYLLTSQSDAIIRTDETQSTNVTISNLEIFTNYTFQVTAVTNAGEGPPSAVYVTATTQAPPSEPVMFKVNQVQKTSITVTWQQPKYPNGIITKYSIRHKITAKPYDITFNGEFEIEMECNVTNLDKLSYTFTELKPTTEYELTVFAISAVGEGVPSIVHQFTNAATADDIVAPKKLQEIMNSDITSTTVGISIPLSTGEFVTGYQVLVQLTPRRGKRQTLSFGHHSDSEESYIAAELPKDNIIENNAFVVGDNKTYEMFYNAPLIPGETFTLYTAYVSRINNTTYEAVVSEGTKVTLPSTDKSPPSVIGPVVATVVIVVLLVVAVVLGGIVYKRRQVKKSPTSTPHSIGLTNQGTSEDTTDRAKGVQNKAFAETEASDKQIANRPSRQTNRLSLGALVGPIKLTVLEKYVNEKKDNQCKSFKVDFKTLPGDNLDSWDAAKKPENRKKNRYANITTYDKARVILETLENDPHSDYINASYIDGLYETEKYIASQGPNTRSLHDFWRMIWQHKIMKIVMLTNLVERGKGKCEKYWPDIVTEMGGVTVTPLREEEYAGYLIRFFTCEKSGERRELRQYHYTTWPDMGVPDCPGPVLNFMKLVNGYIPEDAGPPVIHCSAGVGRTGTYIAIDSLIEQGKREGAVDVFGFVSNMRRNRMNMVQTSEQYQFIFDALLEETYCGDTSYPSTSFESEFSKLKKIDPKTGKSGLMKQFEALEKVTVRPSESKCQGGTNPINVQKNRYPDIIPTDRSRPYLMAEVDEHSTNYINAAYIDSYQVRNQHIVTQIPLPETVPDIWRMVYDYNFHTIAMVNTLDYKDPSIAKYWPDQGQTLTFGPYTVTCVKEDERPHDVTVRTFQVFNQQDKDGERMISQISLRNWLPTEDEPGSVDSVLALMNSMKMWQKQEDCADSKRVVIQCIDGVGASCTFCAIMLVLEKLECDPNIDIFQTVRRLRTIRPQAVRNLVQYTFCYKAIEAHLRSDAIYGNL